MQVLLDNDAKVNAMGINDATPLHHAAQYGHVDCINLLLLDKKTSLHALNNEKKTCLDLAVENSQMDACKALLSHDRYVRRVVHLCVLALAYMTPFSARNETFSMFSYSANSRKIVFC